ncbi:hypothetical protein BE20_0003 [Staphylococcus phage vB_SepS_BE20]|nr:hypothetical protein BE20_0003 [Staphylococcus phage vB_SepS_BE20]
MSVCVFVTPRDILCTTTTRTDCVSSCYRKGFLSSTSYSHL